MLGSFQTQTTVYLSWNCFRLSSLVVSKQNNFWLKIIEDAEFFIKKTFIFIRIKICLPFNSFNAVQQMVFPTLDLFSNITENLDTNKLSQKLQPIVFHPSKHPRTILPAIINSRCFPYPNSHSMSTHPSRVYAPHSLISSYYHKKRKSVRQDSFPFIFIGVVLLRPIRIYRYASSVLNPGGGSEIEAINCC